MIKLGVNTVLFAGSDLETAMRHIKWAGYDGVELSAIKGMCEHLELDRWREQAEQIKSLSRQYGLELLSMEVASQDESRLTKAFEAGAAIGVPVVNIGPGKGSGEADLAKTAELVNRLADKAASHGVTLCVKAHVGCVVFNTPTTLRLMELVKSKGFGVDMDPSHIYRAGEDPAKALKSVMKAVRHVHIRDCKGRGPKPGEPAEQACGRGDIDLMAYCKAMVDGGYDGPVCLEVIGAGKYELSQRAVVAAESYGYLNACLKALGARN